MDEGTRESTDDEGLPEVVLGRCDHEFIELRARIGDRKPVVDDVVVDRVSREEFAEIETVCLFQELHGNERFRQERSQARLGRGMTYFDVGGMGCSVSERHEHDSRDVDDLTIDLENSRGGLHLSFETVRGSTEPTASRVIVSRRATQCTKESRLTS